MKSKTSIAVWMFSVVMALGADHIVGVGMELSKGSENGPPKIKGVVSAGPAAQAGIEPGWILLSINGTNTAGRSMSECVSLVRGEAGTTVRLELADPAHGRTNKVTLTREKILTPGSPAKGKSP
jgi:carboxyl-terminal processing protease